MEIEKMVRDLVVSYVENCEYEPKALFDGLDAYARDQGFEELVPRFSEKVVESIVRNNLAPVLSMKPETVVLYFSNYELIERVRLANNRSLALAAAVYEGQPVSPSELEKLESEFEACTSEVCAVKGLRKYLSAQISETVLNIDYAKGNSQELSQRLGALVKKDV